MKKVIVNACSSILAFIMVLVTEVGIRLTIGNETSKPLYKGFFKFISDSQKAGMYNFARSMMIIGFVLVVVCMLYSMLILILFVLKQHKIVSKLSTITKFINIILVVSMFVILLAGLDKHEYNSQMINNITLFGLPWVLGLIFSIVPIASKYFIKE